jgi:hypothetical protein
VKKNNLPDLRHLFPHLLPPSKLLKRAGCRTEVSEKAPSPFSHSEKDKTEAQGEQGHKLVRVSLPSSKLCPWLQGLCPSPSVPPPVVLQPCLLHPPPFPLSGGGNPCIPTPVTSPPPPQSAPCCRLTVPNGITDASDRVNSLWL